MTAGEPEVTLRAAQALITAGHWEQASRILRAVLAESPDHPVALVSMAECALGVGDSERALTAATSAAAADPALAQALIVRSRALSSLGRHRESRQNADAAARLDPLSFPAHLQRSAADVAAGRNTPAGRASVQALLQLAPDEPDTHVVVGNHHFIDGNRRAAQRSYRTALGINPDHRTAQYNLALTHGHTFGWEASVRLLRGLIRMDPTELRYATMLRSVLSLTLVVCALFSAVVILVVALPGPGQPDPDAARLLVAFGTCMVVQVAALAWVRRLGGPGALEVLAPGRLGTGWRTTVLYLAAAALVLADLGLLAGAALVGAATTLSGIAMVLTLIATGLVIVSMSRPTRAR